MTRQKRTEVAQRMLHALLGELHGPQAAVQHEVAGQQHLLFLPSSVAHDLLGEPRCHLRRQDALNKHSLVSQVMHASASKWYAGTAGATNELSSACRACSYACRARDPENRTVFASCRSSWTSIGGAEMSCGLRQLSMSTESTSSTMA